MPFGEADSRTNFVSVGSVDDHSARLWFRAPAPGRYVVEVRGAALAPLGRAVVELADNPRDNTATVVYPDAAAPGAAPLLPLHRYTFRVASEDGKILVGEGGFETAPANNEQTPPIFTVGILSCHKPFADDGSLDPASMLLLDQLPAAFAKTDIKFLLTVGDQIYADEPGQFSLLDASYGARWGRGTIDTWTQEQVRAAYQERHRLCWNQPSWLKLISSFPTYAICDDHEVFDDWGSKPEHAAPPWSTIIAGAREAYLDYQGSRQLGWSGAAGSAPAACDYGFRYGTVATFVFDLRSERQAGPTARVISGAQLDRFKAFLAANRDAHVVLVVTSVPFVHLPEWLTEAGEAVEGTNVDFPDHWSAERNQADRAKVLEAIRQHLDTVPKQKLIVVGGDVHIGCAFTLKFVGGAKSEFYELTTSSVTNRLSPFRGAISELGPAIFERCPRIAQGTVDVSLLRHAMSAGPTNQPRPTGLVERREDTVRNELGLPEGNPTAALNVGLIELKRNGDKTNVRLRLIGAGTDGQATDLWVSGWL